jgi:two-component system CheB/CheR fusion protein
VKAPRRVVGIGASAGGLESLRGFFSAVPRDSGCCFVVVQHLSPDFKSFMRDILSRDSCIPVVEMEDGARLEADTIYVLVPNKNVTLVGDRLVLQDIVRREGPNKPIDLFFQSLAREHGATAIGVILSGTGNDGSLGARALHDAGARVLCESPDTAKFDGMPQALLDAQLEDFVASPADLALEATRQPDPGPVSGVAPRRDESPLNPAHTRIFGLIQDAYGVDFGQYKLGTVLRRLEKRMLEIGMESPERYLAHLEASPTEVAQLYDEMLIGVTAFFRDAEAFASLEREAISAIVRDKAPGETVRVWVPGCSSGEEAYGLAMLIREACLAQGKNLTLKIFASDLDDNVLRKASAGNYDHAVMAGVSPELRERYFTVRDHGYKVNPKLRRSVVFTRHNALGDPPFRDIDLVSCRNMLIYFKEDAQASALLSFFFSLRDGGFLFLGPSESLGVVESGFRALDRRWRIYEKLSGARLPRELETRFKRQKRRLQSVTPGITAHEAHNDLDSAFHALLQRYVPPSLLVTEDLDVLHSFADAGQYLHPRPGAPGTNLRNLAHDQLVTAVRVSLQRAKRDRDAVAYRGVEFDNFGNRTRLDVTVWPLPASRRRSATSLYLVSLQAADGNPAEESASIDIQIDRNGAQRIAALESELQSAKENLSVTVEELEATNEELQSTNEELLASNEELQSTNEELHSVNEELYSVNGEYQAKIDELRELVQDEQSLFSVTQVGAIFLDAGLRLRRFTPYAADAFGIQASDIGRPLAHVLSRLDVGSLDEQLSDVLRGAGPIAHEVHDRSGTPYLLRLSRHQPTAGSAGVVMSVVDLTKTRANERAFAAQEKDLASARLRSSHLEDQLAKELAEHHELLTGSTPYGVWDWPDVNRDAQVWSNDFYSLLGYAPGELTASRQALSELLHPRDREPTFEALDAHFAAGTAFDLELQLRTRAGDYRSFRCTGKVQRDTVGAPARMVAVVQPRAALQP